MKRRLSNLAIVLGIGLSALATLAVAQPHDRLVGTWVLNAAKSKFSPGPAPKSQMTIFEAAGQGYKVTVKSTPSVGAEFSWSYTTLLDGHDAAITGANPNADTASTRRINPTVTETIFKKSGKVTTTNSAVVSPDGKTRTVTTKGGSGAGAVYNVAVYDKQ